MKLNLAIATELERPKHHELWRFAEPAVRGGHIDIRAPDNKQRAATKEQALLAADPVEWKENRAVVVTVQDFQAGDVEVLNWMKDGKLVESGYLKVHLSATAHLKLAPGEFTDTAPNISVPAAVLDKVDWSQSSVRCLSIENGIAEIE